MAVEGTLYEGALVADRYELKASLGTGGFGEVWEALDRRFGRAVAVKFMRVEMARDATLRRRFGKEARAMAAISHPNVVQVHDDGEWEGRPFVVLQLVEGTTLREWMESYQKLRKLPPAEEVRTLFAQVCEGVGAAHQKGIVHRDLKPENVLIGYDEEGRATARVLDFGLAGGGALQTATVVQGGTIQYMSPEQASDGAEAAGTPSDVFALGVMLVELLTRRLLPEPPKQTTWWNAAQLGRAPAALESAAAVRGDVPAAVWAVVAQALAVDPGGRAATAGALRRAVEVAWAGASASTTASAVGGSAGVAATGVAVGPMASVMAMPSMVMGQPVPVAAQPVPVVAPTKPVAAQPVAVPDLVDRERPSVTASLKKPRLVIAAVTAAVMGLGAVALVVTSGSSAPAHTDGPTTVPTVVPAPAPAAAPAPPPPPTCPEGMALVPAGTFAMGSPEGQGDASEHPQHQVQLSAFCMDRTEVTVAAYRDCVTAGSCTAAATTEYCNGGRTDRDNHPINCVDWVQAVAFCRSRSAVLPTEAQWEYAARGTDGRTYPWGNDAPGPQLCWSGGGTAREGTCPVSTYPSGNSPFGLSDMAGNVWEWTADWHAAYTVQTGSSISDPSGPTDGTNRVFRGGGWSSRDAAWVRAALRNRYAPAYRYNNLGFRCARGAR